MNTKYKLSDFQFPTESGQFSGTLIDKKLLENKPCLFLYFLSEKKEMIVLPIWKHSKTGHYTPDKSDWDFENDVDIGTKWQCRYTVSKSSNGTQNTRFISASRLFSSEDNERFFAEKFYFLLIKKAFPRCLIADICIEKLSNNDLGQCIFSDKNLNFSYIIAPDDNKNWAIIRRKKGISREKDAVVIINSQTYDIVSKNYI